MVSPVWGSKENLSTDLKGEPREGNTACEAGKSRWRATRVYARSPRRGCGGTALQRNHVTCMFAIIVILDDVMG